MLKRAWAWVKRLFKKEEPEPDLGEMNPLLMDVLFSPQYLDEVQLTKKVVSQFLKDAKEAGIDPFEEHDDDEIVEMAFRWHQERTSEVEFLGRVLQHAFDEEMKDLEE